MSIYAAITFPLLAVTSRFEECARGLTGTVAELRDYAFCYGYLTTFLSGNKGSQYEGGRRILGDDWTLHLEAVICCDWGPIEWGSSWLCLTNSTHCCYLTHQRWERTRWLNSPLTSCHRRAWTTVSARSLYVYQFNRADPGLVLWKGVSDLICVDDGPQVIIKG